MWRWLTGRGAAERAVADQAERLTPAVWQAALAQHDFLAGLAPADLEALRLRTAWLLASKRFSAAQGLVLTDDILLAIAVQAALPILALSPQVYEGWHEIIVYPGGFLIPRQEHDDAGVVHEYVQEAAGEAWDGGPVILSWHDVRQTQGDMNVVIHEFAHKIDLNHGAADGIPDLSAHPQLSPRQWHRVLTRSYQQFCAQLDAIERAIPRHIDPEGPAADPWYAQLPLDPYAATDEAEFFAVSSEAFFVAPDPLARQLPEWYALLAAYYRQDPWRRWQAQWAMADSATRLASSGGTTPGN